MNARLFAILAAIGCMFSAATTVAQEKIDPTEAQVQLYEKATQAYLNEQYPEAIELLRSALALGELNALYLNLGRAYFRDGNCAEAEAAYARALTAPAMSEPSPSAVRAKVDEYRADMRQGCPGTLVLTCTPGEMLIVVDRGPEQACGEIMLPPGVHIVRGKLLDQTTETTVEITSLERTEATLSMEMVMAPTPEPTPTPTESDGVGLITWTTLGVGAVTLGTAFVLDATLAGPAVDDFETAVLAGDSKRDDLRGDAEAAQNTVLIVGGVGAAILVTGAVLLVVDLTDGPSDAAETDAAASVGIGPGSVTFTTRW